MAGHGGSGQDRLPQSRGSEPERGGCEMMGHEQRSQRGGEKRLVVVVDRRGLRAWWWSFTGAATSDGSTFFFISSPTQEAIIDDLKLSVSEIGQSHPTGLTANLLKLFEPRPPLEYKPPPEKRKCPPLTGMAQFVSKFAEPGEPEYAPPVSEVETPAQRRARIHKLRLEKGAAKATEELEKYDPHISGDPYKTLWPDSVMRPLKAESKGSLSHMVQSNG